MDGVNGPADSRSESGNQRWNGDWAPDSKPFLFNNLRGHDNLRCLDTQ